LAEIEARIDFEEDLPPLDHEAVLHSIEQVFCQVNLILATAERGELLRSGLKVAIVGRPNVGKSSLLNAWSRSDRAIVTDLPGTTRDIVESQLVVAGIPVQVLDTAGIRSASDRVEQIGVERSRQTARSADLVLLTVSAESGWTEEDEEIYRSVSDRRLILVINKIDLVNPETVIYPAEIERVVKLSAVQNQGIEDLEKTIINAVQNQEIQAANLDLAINQRQAAALTRAKIALEQVKKTIYENLPFDFWSIDLRTAIQALGEITGEEVTESVLDRIFSRFCIGK
jgi:tRNA modification GTPase